MEELADQVIHLKNRGQSGIVEAMDGNTVLIIEDEALLRTMLAKSIEQKGFTVFQAEGGRKGKEIALETSPDVILLDIMLPGEDGMQILTELRANEKTKTTPIIVISNLSDAEHKQKCMELGATDYLVKADYRLDQMVAKVQEICAKHTK